MSRCLVTGGAGFIGSHLVARLLAEGHSVAVFDDLSLGRREHVPAAARFTQADLLDLEAVEKAVDGQDAVFHLAANSDIDFGRRQSDRDLRQGTLATYNVLEAMRRRGVKKLVFASTSAVYGETPAIALREDYGPLLPISLYGASKLACEGLISAFAHNYGVQAWIYRFANVVGANATHGAIFDFARKLKKDPKRLEVLGDGTQSKPYLLASDVVDGMLFGFSHAGDAVNLFNLACEGGTSVAEIARIVVEEAGLSGVAVSYSGGKRGWVGDVPFVRMDPAKLAALGWKARHDSTEAVRLAARAVVAQVAQSASL